MRTYERVGIEGGCSTMGRPASRTADENGTIVLMLLAGASMIAQMSVHGTLLGAVIIAGALVVIFPNQAKALLTKIDKIEKRWGVNPYLMMLGLLSTVFVLDYMAQPASAQFFLEAENWIKNTGFAGANNADTAAMVTAIFNTLRMFFLVYIGVSIVVLVKAARDGDDWQSAAKMPMMVLLGVFIADVLTTVIT
ncbi:hypothetical protein [Nostoc sp. MG11]|uniref:hypothetical protein n=1 Tax=Nostoc sp. MG11 TaxID=2721166 RepID=UPI001867258E|nr:hypothetical protein [Nostoc sp. MG11]